VGNLDIYNKLCTPPKEALKEIKGGRMSGKSDINPMWRLKALTEQFGPCGIGWYYEITKQWLETGGKEEISAFCDINLFIKNGEEWSKPIPGVGGSSFVALEGKGLYTSDECYKMALTDALSVACKALGVAANVYWDKDPSKYDKSPQESQGKPELPTNLNLSQAQANLLWRAIKAKFGANANEMVKPLTGHDKLSEIPIARYDEVMKIIEAYKV
jgi:hypothetical protein